jgi:glutamyl-tRNA reductase
MAILMITVSEVACLNPHGGTITVSFILWFMQSQRLLYDIAAQSKKYIKMQQTTRQNATNDKPKCNKRQAKLQQTTRQNTNRILHFILFRITHPQPLNILSKAVIVCCLISQCLD